MSEQWEEGFWPPPNELLPELTDEERELLDDPRLTKQLCSVASYRRLWSRLKESEAENQRLKDDMKYVQQAMVTVKRENQRLKDELEAYRRISLDLAEEAERMRTQLYWPQYAGLPLKGVVKDGKVEWTGVDSPQQTDEL